MMTSRNYEKQLFNLYFDVIFIYHTYLIGLLNG